MWGGERGKEGVDALPISISRCMRVGSCSVVLTVHCKVDLLFLVTQGEGDSEVCSVY